MNAYARFFEGLPDLRVVVVGDLMLDTYFFGQVDRISPEAPVPVVAHQRQEERIGGAGNVALNLKSLGAKVQLISLVGQDESARLLKELLHENAIDTDWLLADPTRPTTRKTRVLDRNKQLLRLDQESTADIDPDSEAKWLNDIEAHLKRDKPHLLILEDYNKGFLTASLIEQLIRLCRELGIVTAVDPKKKNFFAYEGVDLFKPNWREVTEAHAIDAKPDLHRLKDVHRSLTDRLQHQVSLITLSERGVFYQQRDQADWIPCIPRVVMDVSGAGDTVIAVAAAAYALTKDATCMANLANLAGGLVCEQVGTSPIDADRLKNEAVRLGWI